MIYEKTNINNFKLHTIKTTNFKSIKIMINFRRKLLKKEASVNALLFLLLIYRTKNYDYKSLIEKKEDLYKLILNSNTDYENDEYKNSSIHLKFLHPKYTYSNIELDVLKLFKEVIFNPIFDDSKTNRNIKELLKSKIISIKEEKVIHARNLMSELLNCNYPNKYGYIDELDNLTEKEIENYYNDMITNDQIDIFVVGDIDSKLYIDYFKDLFKTNKRYNKKTYSKYKKIEEKEHYIEEKDINQAKLLVSLKPINFDIKDKEINRLYTSILGGGTSSKLFKIIREKYSLAYYASIYREDLQISIIESGIDIKNYDKTIKLIRKCLKDMSNITIEDLNIAKTRLINMLEKVEYNQNAIIDFYLTNELLEEDKTINERIEEINKVTLEDVLKFNEKVHIDNILLYGDKNE